MRDIFINNNKINYENYKNIVYDFDYIEEELGKIILPKIKRFTNKIKFITYFLEGFKGENSNILTDFNLKYIQKELCEEDKKLLFELIKNNKNEKYYYDIYSSLLIIINEVIKDNYEQNYNIYKIIKELPNYIKLNYEIVNFFNKNDFTKIQ